LFTVHKSAETIQGRKLFKGGNYSRKYGNFVNFDFFFTKLSEVGPFEKRIDYPGGHAWGHVCMAFSKLEAMAVYLVKHACGNDKLACV
jgi:hypothetical protein